MKTYRVGSYPDGQDVWVEGIDDFWPVAHSSSKNGAKFNPCHYEMMCFDALPQEVREAISKSVIPFNAQKLYDLYRQKGYSVKELLSYIRFVDARKNH